MYGERQYYEAWQRALAAMNCTQQPVSVKKKERDSPLKGRPSPLRGRKLSAEHIRKLKKPKTEAQKAALRVPKRNTSNMGQYERTEEWRKNAASRARVKKSESTRKKMSVAKKGAKNPKYKEYVFGVVHPKYGMFFGERMELHKQFPNDLPLKELRKLAIGEYASYNGWRLVQKAPK